MKSPGECEGKRFQTSEKGTLPFSSGDVQKQQQRAWLQSRKSKSVAPWEMRWHRVRREESVGEGVDESCVRRTGGAGLYSRAAKSRWGREVGRCGQKRERG